MRTVAGLSDVSRRVAAAPKTGAVTPKKGIFAKISEYARRVAGVVGLVAGAGIAAASNGPAPQYWEKPDVSAVTKPAAPGTPTPNSPSRTVVTELRDREWKAVVEKGQGARDFAMKSFGTDDWGLLVDEEGNRLSDPTKLRQGKRYLVAKDAKDAQIVAAAVKAMGGMNLSNPAAKSKHAAPAANAVSKPVVRQAEAKVTSDSLVSYAEEHLGKPYRLGANGVKAIDCSQLVVETLKKAGIVGEKFDTTAAGFHGMSKAKKLSQVGKGDLLFLHKGSGHVSHVAIALSAPDAKGYIDIIDASSSQGAVTKRKFHMSMAGLSAGSLPFVGTTVAPDSLPVYAQAAETAKKTVAKATEAVADSTVKLASAVGDTIISSARAEELPRANAPKAARAVSKPSLTVVAKSSAPVRAASATPVRQAPEKIVALDFEIPSEASSSTYVETPKFVEVERPSAKILDFPAPETAKVAAVTEKVEARVNATVVSLASRVSDREQAASIRASLEKKSLSEQIEHFRAISEAANDPVYSMKADVTASKLEMVKLHGERKLVSDNISYYKIQAAKSVPGAYETVLKLNKVAASLDSKIQSLKTAVNDAEFQLKKAA
ncbi:MAG: NlpC/P60 family protein [Patescibacteria group bacterium]